MAIPAQTTETQARHMDQHHGRQEGRTRVTAGTTSIRAVPDGVIIRQGSAEVKIWKHQILRFTEFAVDWYEIIEQRAGQENE